MMKKNDVISFQEAAANPSYTGYHAAIRAIEQVGPALAVTDKFLEGQKELIGEELEIIFEQTPNLPLHIVLSKILENLPDYLSGVVLLDLTRFAIEQWEKVQEMDSQDIFQDRKVLHRL